MAKQPTFIPQPTRNNVESTLRLHRALRKDLAAVEKRLKDLETQLGKLVRGEFKLPRMIRQK